MIEILPGTIAIVFIVSFVFLIYDFITRYLAGDDAIVPDSVAKSSLTSIAERTTAKGVTPIEELAARTDFPDEAAVSKPSPSISETPTVSSWMAPVVSPTQELQPLVGDSESPIPPAAEATSDVSSPSPSTSLESDPSTPKTTRDAEGVTPLEEPTPETNLPEEAAASKPSPSRSQTPTVSPRMAPVVSPTEEPQPLVEASVPLEEDNPSEPSTPTEAPLPERTNTEVEPSTVEPSTSGIAQNVEEESPIAATVVPPIVEPSASETVDETEDKPPASQTTEPIALEAKAPPSQTLAVPEAASESKVSMASDSSDPSTPEMVTEEEEPPAPAAEVASKTVPETAPETEPSTPETVEEATTPATAEPSAPEAEASTALESSKEPTDDDNDTPPDPPSGGISSKGSTAGEVANKPPTAAKQSPKTAKSRKSGGKRTNKNQSGGGQGFGFFAPQNPLDLTSPPTQPGNDRPPKPFRLGWAMAILLLLGLGGTQIFRFWESRPRQLAAIETLNSQTGTTKTALLQELQVSPTTLATYARAWGISEVKPEFSTDEAAKISSTAAAMRSGAHPTWQAYLDATLEQRTLALSKQTDGVKNNVLPQRYDRLRAQVSQTVTGVATEIHQNLDLNVVEPLFAAPSPAVMVSQGYGDCPPSRSSNATNPPTAETSVKYLQAEARSE